MLSGFHAGHGLYFERLHDGRVQVKRETPVGSSCYTPLLTVDAATWASVVAAVSLQGDSGERHLEALHFHNKPQP